MRLVQRLDHRQYTMLLLLLMELPIALMLLELASMLLAPRHSSPAAPDAQRRIPSGPKTHAQMSAQLRIPDEPKAQVQMPMKAEFHLP